MKKKVVFRAPALTLSGYGVHARQIARYLIEKADANEIELYIELTRWGNTPFAIQPEMCDGLIGKVIKYSRPPVSSVNGQRFKCDVSIQLLLPSEWDPSIARTNIGMSAFVESTKCNQTWIDACNSMDMIIVPSSHVKTTICKSGDVQKPIHVIPESYPDAFDSQTSSLDDIKFETSFNFLVVGQLTGSPVTDRKNTFNTIKHLCDVFKSDPDVGILIKTNSSRNTKQDRRQTEQLLRRVLNDVRKGPYPRFHLIHGNMSDAEMKGLYTHPSVKALLTLSHGEGFGLPVLEAAALGLPVIATDWSAYLDFMNHGKFVRIGYTLDMIPAERIDGFVNDDYHRNIWIKGAQWAIPSDKNVIAALKKFRVSPEIPKQWALDLQHIIREKYCYRSIRAHYDALLTSLLM